MRDFSALVEAKCWLARAKVRLDAAANTLDDRERLHHQAKAAEYERYAEFVILYHRSPFEEENPCS